MDAWENGRFQDEILPVDVPGKKGRTILSRDDGPRSDSTLEKLSALRPVFRKGGSVTAGNASTMNDGAAAILLASASKAKALGIKPLARIVSVGSAGIDPRIMGMGPVPATRKALDRASLCIEDIDLIEINEAFAVQALAVARDLNLSLDEVNVNGGAIAIGHPLGASGARILATLVHEMARRGVAKGLATLCVGVGQGESMIVVRD